MAKFMSYTPEGRLAGAGTDLLTVAAAPAVVKARAQAFEMAALECERMARGHVAHEAVVLLKAAVRIRALAT